MTQKAYSVHGKIPLVELSLLDGDRKVVLNADARAERGSELVMHVV